MKEDWRSLLVPEVLNEVSGLELIARVIVEGYISGLHGSRKTGAGLEFSQYRAYEPGDDLRLLDWKMLARSGRYYIKQSDIETNLVLRVILDASGSMQYAEEGVSKWMMARVIAASLAYLGSRQRDDLSLYRLNDQHPASLHVREDARQLPRFLQQLIDTEITGGWPSGDEPLFVPGRDKKEIVVFISDFLQEEEEISDMLKRLKTNYNEVLACFLVGKKEESLDFDGQLIFEDLENGRKREVNALRARAVYTEAFKSFRERIREDLEESGITWLPFYLDENPGTVLASYIRHRNRMIR